MSNIDNRVVQMEFDNKEFEQGIQTSIKSIQNLEKSLKLEDSAKGFTNIEKTANSISFGGLSSSVENINWHFTWLGRTVDRVLDNITNKAISTAKNLVSAFTTESMTQGFEEYELKMGSIQTIMAGTGESLQTVSRYLDELNTYADKTIYSFSDMTANIGKFTNAGVDLDSAVKAIQGVSNVAAVSGANTNEASRAMYNFAQALSAGYVKLIDWKSIENANMATVEFKQQLIDTAVEMGTLTKRADGMYQVVGKGADHAFNSTREFNEYLSDAWLTNNVLVDTLGDYANAETEIGKKAFAAAQDVKTFTQLMDTLKEAMGSGWARTFELIIGDFNQAKEMFTGVSNVLGGFIDKISDSRNSMLEGALSGSSTIFYEDWINLGDEAITNNQVFIKSLKDTAKAHGIAIDEMIANSGGFAKSLDEGWLTLDILNEALDSSGKTASETIQTTTQNLEDLKNIAQRVIKGDFGNGEARVKALTEAGYDYATVQGIVNKMLKGEEIVLDNLSQAEMKQIGYTDEEIAQLEALKKQAQETNTPLNNLIKGFQKPTGRDLLIDSVKNAFTGFVKTLTSIRDAYRDIFPPMTSDRLYSIIEGFNKFTKSLIPSQRTLNRFRLIFRGLFSVIDIGKMALSSVIGGFRDVAKSMSPIGDVILDIGGKIGKFLYKIRNTIKESNLFGRIVGTAFKLASYGFEKITNSIKMVSDRVLGLAKDDTKGLGKFVKNVLNGIKPLSKIGTFVKDSFEILEKYTPQTAIKILGIRIKNSFDKLELSDFIHNSLSKIMEFGRNIIEKIRSIFSGSRVGNVFDSISNFVSGIKERFKGVSKVGEFFSRTFRIISEKISIAWNWLKGVFEKIKDSGAIGDVIEFLKSLFTIDLIRNLSKFTKSLSGIGDLFKKTGKVLDGVTGVLNAVKNSLKAWQKEIKSKAIKNIAIAMGILVAALFVLTRIDSEKLYNAMSYMGLMFAGLAGALAIFDELVGDGKKLKDASKAFVPLAASILILSFAVGKLAKMDWPSIGKGATAIGILMTEIAGFTRLTSKGFTASNGMALIGMAIGIRLLIGAISKFAKLDVGSAVTGMTELAILLTEIGVFTRIASKGFKASNAIGILALGLALSVFVGAVKSLSKLDVGSAVTGMTELAILLTEIGVFTRVTSKAKGLVKSSLSLVIVGGALHIFISAIKKISSISGENLTKGLISIGIALTELLVAMKMMSGTNSIKGALSMALITSTLGLLVPLFRQLGSINNVAQTGIGLSATILSLSGAIKLLNGIPFGGGLKAAETLAEIIAGITLIVMAAGAIRQIPGVDWLMNEAQGFFENLGKAIGGFVGGILGGIAEGMASTLPSIGQYLTDFMTNAQGFIDSATAIGQNENALKGIDTLVSAILKLTAAEVLDALAGWFTGGSSLVNFSAQLPSLGLGLSNFNKFISSINDFDKITEAAEAIGAIALIDIPPSGGLLQALIGETDFSKFGSQLPILGFGLKSFYSHISSISNAENIPAIFNVIKDLLAIEIPENKGLLPWLRGMTDFEEFGNQLSGFGSGLSGFFTSVKDFDGNKLGAVLDQIERLANMSTSLSTFNVDAFWNFGTALSGLSTIDLQPAIEVVNSWDESFTDSGKSLGESVISGIKSGISFEDVDLSDIGKGFVSTFTSSISSETSSAKEKVLKFIYTIMSAAITKVKAYNGSFKTAGQTLATNIGSGISSKSLNSNVKSILNSANSTIQSYYSQFKASGAYLVDGIIAGMLDRMTLLRTTAKSLAEMANREFRNTLSINSPSRVMEENGKFFDVGFANGVLKYARSVTNATKEIASGAIDVIAYGIRKVEAIANSDMEFSPTIRPVVDLEEISNGINQMNTLFDQNGSVSIGSNPYQFVQRTALAMGKNSQREIVNNTPNNSDVVDAINVLREEVGTLKNAIASMKVVTDTGALVGQIESKVDQRLGIRTSHKERGI